MALIPKETGGTGSDGHHTFSPEPSGSHGSLLLVTCRVDSFPPWGLACWLSRPLGFYFSWICGASVEAGGHRREIQ